MKALQFERLEIQAKFFKQLLELIDIYDFSGKQRDVLQGEIHQAPQLTKVQLRRHKQPKIIEFANFILAHVDKAWDSSVDKTAQTINSRVVRPAKQVRTLGSKLYEKMTLGVSNQLERGKTQVKSGWTVFFKNAEDLLRFGIEQGRSKAQSVNQRLSIISARSSRLRK